MAKATLKEIKPEDVVFDDRNLNRHTEKGKELDEKYCDVDVRRWIAQMGKDGAKYSILLNGQPAPDKVQQLLNQGGNAANEEEE